MGSNMEEIDKLIKDTLSEEESKFYEGLEEQNIFESVLGLFQGKNKLGCLHAIGCRRGSPEKSR